MTDLDVAVVGAGAAGLAVAHALRAAGRSVRVFEAEDRVGGRMRTHRENGYLIDEGAEMLAPRGFPATWRLIDELGLATEEVPRITGSLAVWRDDRVWPDVGSPRSLLTGGGLSWRGRLALLRFQADCARRRRRFDPERPESTPLGAATVAQLAGTYGEELFRFLYQPLTGGFFGWDAQRSALGPAVAHQLAIGGPARWRTYRDGMDTLARRLAERLEVTTGSPVREVSRTAGGARLRWDDGALTARAVVLCTPAPVAAALRPDAPEDERPFLRSCTYAPMLRVSCALDQPLQPHGRRRVFVLMVPPAHDPVLAGLTVDHNKHPLRVPPGAGLVTLLSAPSATRDLLDAPDDEVVRTLTRRAERCLPGLTRAARTLRVHRFRHGLPEVTPRALALRAAFLRRPVRAVEYAGDWVAQRPSGEGALRSAELAAARVLVADAGSGSTPAPTRGGRRG